MSKTIHPISHQKEIGRATNTNTVCNMDDDVRDGTLGRDDAMQDSALKRPVLTITTPTEELQDMKISASLDTLDLYFPDSPVEIPGLRVPSWRQEVAKGGGVLKARCQRREGGRIDELEAWKTGDSSSPKSNSLRILTLHNLMGANVDDTGTCDFENKSLDSPYTPLSSISHGHGKGQSGDIDGTAQCEDTSLLSEEGLPQGSGSLLGGLTASKRRRGTGGISKKQSSMSVRSRARQSPIISVRQGVSHMPVAPVLRTSSSASSTGKGSPRIGPPAYGGHSSPHMGLVSSPGVMQRGISPIKRGVSPIRSGASPHIDYVSAWGSSGDYSKVLYGASGSFVGAPFGMNDYSPMGSPMDRRQRTYLSPLRRRPSVTSPMMPMVAYDQQLFVSPSGIPDHGFAQGSRAMSLQALRFGSKSQSHERFMPPMSPLRRRRLDSTDRPFAFISMDEVEQLANPPEKPLWGQEFTRLLRRRKAQHLTRVVKVREHKARSTEQTNTQSSPTSRNSQTSLVSVLTAEGTSKRSEQTVTDKGKAFMMLGAGSQKQLQAERLQKTLDDILEKAAAGPNLNIQLVQKHGVDMQWFNKRMSAGIVTQEMLERVCKTLPKEAVSKEQKEACLEKWRLAEKTVLLKDLHGAHSQFLKAIEHDPTHKESLYSVGRILSQLGKFQASKLFFERVLVLHPASEKALFVLGNIMHVLGDHLVALPLLEAVAEGYHRDVDMSLEERPHKSSKATYLTSVAICGLLYQTTQNDLERAEGCYDIVLKEEPTHIKANDFKCALRVMQGRESEASEMHRELCKIHTKHLSRPCAYLDALFPQTSSMLHPISNLKERIGIFSNRFSVGASTMPNSMVRKGVNLGRRLHAGCARLLPCLGKEDDDDINFI